MTGKKSLENLGNLMHNDEGILPVEEGKLCMFFMFKSFSVALLLTASLVGSIYGIHFLVHADSTTSTVAATEGRPEARGLAQVDFVKAGSCALTNTPYNLLDFDDYGCYCGTSFSGGVAGLGEPVDSIDRCCMDYDKRIREIVGDNTLQGLGSLIAVPYDVDCDTSSSPFPQPKCSNDDDPMSKAICESDKELFTCWRANLPSYSLFNLNMSSPGQESCGPRDRNDPIADVLRLVRMAHGAKAAFVQAQAIGGEVSRQATSVLQTLAEKVYDPNPQLMLEKLAVELEENDEILPPKLRAQFDSFMGMPEFQIFTQQVLPATKSFMDSVRELGSAFGRVDLSKNFAEVKALAEEARFALQNRRVSAGMQPEPDSEPSDSLGLVASCWVPHVRLCGDPSDTPSSSNVLPIESGIDRHVPPRSVGGAGWFAAASVRRRDVCGTCDDRFSHAGPPGGSGGSGGSNRYAGKQDQPMGYAGGQGKGGSSYGGRQGTSARAVKQVIESDMKEEMPMWPLTCYGYEREGPNIIDKDVSFEEVRAWQYGFAVQAGQPPCAIPEVTREFQEFVSKKQTLMHRLKTLPLKVLQNLIDNNAVLDESNIQNQPATKGSHRNNSMQFDKYGVGHPIGQGQRGSAFPPNGPSGGMGQGTGYTGGMQPAGGTGPMFEQQQQYVGGPMGMQQPNAVNVAGAAVATPPFPQGTGGFQQPSQFLQQGATHAEQGPFAASSTGPFQQANAQVPGFQSPSPMGQSMAPPAMGVNMGQGSAMSVPGQMAATQPAGGATGFPLGGSYQGFDPSNALQPGTTPAPATPGMISGGNGQVHGGQNGFGGPMGQPTMNTTQVGAGIGFQQQGFPAIAQQGPSQSAHVASGTDSNAQMWHQQNFESGQIPDTPPGELFCK